MPAVAGTHYVAPTMRTQRAPILLLHALAIAFAWSCCLLAPSALTAADASSWQATVDSLRQAQDFGGALRSLDEAQTVFEASGDTQQTREIEIARLNLLLRAGETRQCLDRATSFVERVRARRDSTSLAQGLFWKARAYDTLGRDRRAIGVYEELADVSEAIADSLTLGLAETYLARWHQHDGELDAAAERLARSNSIFLAIGRPDRRAPNLVLEGLVAAGRNRPDEALAHWRQGIEASREFDNSSIYISCLSNIAVMEATIGDPSVAVQCWEEARRVAFDREAWRDWLRPTLNLAWMYLSLGRFDDAKAMLDEARTVAADRGFTDLEGDAVLQLAGLARVQREFARSARLYRESIEVIAERGDANGRFQARRGLALVLAELDSVAAAFAQLDLLESERSMVSPIFAVEMDLARASLENRDGRPRDALRTIDAALPRARALEAHATELQMIEEVAKSYEHLEQPDSAIVALEQARELYETLREIPTDAAWREQRSEYAARVYPQLAWLRRHVSGESAAKIHALLQPYKARTLLERIEAPGSEVSASAAEVVSLDRLQNEILDPGEVFLDLYFSVRHTLLFAITRDRCEVFDLPGSDAIETRIRGFRDLVEAVEDGAQSASLLTAAATALYDDLFSEALAIAPTAHSILYSPDGELTTVPLAALLRLSGRSEELLVHRVPSTQILASLRARERSAGPARMLALMPRDAATDLPGTMAEVASLSRRFEDVDVRVLGEGPDPVGAGGWSGYTVVHVASHARIVDSDPWRSAILFDGDGANGGERADSTSTRAGYRQEQLRASEIAKMRVEADLVVLSGCATLGGETFAGAGVLGLSSAFLVAGTSQVLATLWRVDDAATRRFMDGFYAAIARGLAPTPALGAAQDALRADPATAHPFYWAGFVLVGDDPGALDVRARQSEGVSRTLLLAVLVLVGALAVAGWSVRSKFS